MSTPGDRQRRFQFRECLGHGGFGDVYRATMINPGGLKSDVAVKILRDASPDAVRRLRDEGRLLAVLKHPSILRVHDLTTIDGKVSLVTEFVDGEDLSACVTGAGRLPPRAVLEVVTAVAEALDAAFTVVPVDGSEPLRLVHRDVKPSNVRVSRHGEVKLLDFGIAFSQSSDREARTGGTAMMGSLAYMAPERFANAPARTAGDVYALGCTLYEGLAGERLFPDATPVDMARLAADAAVHDRRVGERVDAIPSVPQGLRDLLRRMLSHDADGRPSAAEVAAACEALGDALPGARLKTWCKDRPWADASDGRGPLSGHTLTESPIGGPGALGGSAGSATPAPSPSASIPGATWTEAAFAERAPRSEATLDVAGLADVAASPAPAPAPATTADVAVPSRFPRWAAGLAAVLVLLVVVLVAGKVALSPAGEAAGETPRPAVAAKPSPAKPDATPSAGDDHPRPGSSPSSPSTPVGEAPKPSAPASPSAGTTSAGTSSGTTSAGTPRKPPPTSPGPSGGTSSGASGGTSSSSETSSPPVVDTLVAPAPPPPPPEPKTSAAPGTVQLVGDAKIELRSAGGTYPPGPVPPGSYDVWADFGSGPHAQTRIDVISGATATIRCNHMRYTCQVEY